MPLVWNWANHTAPPVNPGPAWQPVTAAAYPAPVASHTGIPGAYPPVIRPHW